MEAKHLKRLSDAAEVSKLDLSPGAMTIAPIPGGTLAYYGGTYTAAGVTVAIPNALESPVSVSALEFRDLTALFDDEADVTLSVDGSKLILRAGKRKVSLLFNGTPDYTQWAEVRAVQGASVRTSKDSILRELGIASGIAAVTLTVPILTGIRLVGKGKGAGIQAANGSSLVFQSAFAGTAEGEFEAIIPAKDIITVLPVVRDETDLTMILQQRGETGKTLILRGENSIVKIAILAGAWPKTMIEALSKIQFDEPLSVPVSAIRSLATATRVYKASNDAIIRPSAEAEGFVTLETAESEMGQFQETVPGTITRTYVLDVQDLDTAGKLAETNLDLVFSANMGRCKVGNRTLYINCRTR